VDVSEVDLDLLSSRDYSRCCARTKIVLTQKKTTAQTYRISAGFTLGQTATSTNHRGLQSGWKHSLQHGTEVDDADRREVGGVRMSDHWFHRRVVVGVPDN
jgi:hypothetical protein